MPRPFAAWCCALPCKGLAGTHQPGDHRHARLGGVCSQIATEELTFAANFIQSRSFRAFETYFVTTAIYFALAVLLRPGVDGAWPALRDREARLMFTQFSTWDIVRNLLEGGKWTLA